MSDKFDSDFLTTRLRRSNGTGIGNVAGSMIGLRVNLDVGSTWYAVDAEPERVKKAFEESFSDFDLVRVHNLHSMAAGTTIDFVITGLSLGAGIVVTEFLKEAGKSAWKALSSLLPQKERSRDDGDLYGDTVNFSLVIDNNKLSASITLPSPVKGISSEHLLKHFCENALVETYLKEVDRAARNAPLSERLKTYKASKHQKGGGPTGDS